MKVNHTTSLYGTYNWVDLASAEATLALQHWENHWPNSLQFWVPYGSGYVGRPWS